MENKTNQAGSSQGRKRSRNRNGNRNRNRNHGGQNRNPQSNQSSNRKRQGNRNRNRNRNRSRKPKVVELTLWQKILKALSFGAIDPNKKPAQSKASNKKTQPPKQAQGADAKPKSERNKGRAPKIHEVTSPRLYVGNLDYEASESDLEDLFRGVGTVLAAEVVTNSRTQQSKGFAFVEMSTIEEAKRAVDILHDEEFMGRKLLVSGAKSEGPRTSDSTEAEAA